MNLRLPFPPPPGPAPAQCPHCEGWTGAGDCPLCRGNGYLGA